MKNTQVLKLATIILSFLTCFSSIGCNKYKFTDVSGKNSFQQNPPDSEPIEPLPEPVEPQPVPEPQPPVAEPTPTPEQPPQPPIAEPTPQPEPQPTPTPNPVPPEPIVKKETFVIPDRKADILFVVDVSGSMSPDLKKIGEKFKSLSSKLSNIDWQVGITNADVGSGFFTHRFAMNGKVMNMQADNQTLYTVNKNTKNGDIYFLRTISHDGADMSNWTLLGGLNNESPCFYQPYCQVSKPVPLKATIEAMKKHDRFPNNTFFRKDSLFVPVIISDADESEDASDKFTKPEDVLNYYKMKISHLHSGMMGFSFIIQPGDEKCLEYQKKFYKGGWFGKFGVQLDLFAQITGGQSLSVCTKDFATPLSKISEKIQSQIDRVELSEIPVKESIIIKSSPAMNIEWHLDGRKIIFDSNVPTGTQIEVIYQPLPKL